MDVSTNYLLSCFRLEKLTIETESSNGSGSNVVYSFQKDGAETDAKRTEPEELSYFFSNFTSKVVFDMMANGAEPGSDVQNGLLFHSHGKPIHRVNEVYPYTFDFFTETGNAGGPRITVLRAVSTPPSFRLKPDFHHVLQNSFNPIFETLGSQIEDPLQGPDTRLMLQATLAFQGEWNEPFVDAGVRQFTLLDGRVVRTPFMTSKGKHYVQQYKNFKLLSVPFKQHQASRFSMLFYLPDHIEDYKDLQSFIGIVESVIQDAYFPEEQVQVGNFLIPKFGMTVFGPLVFEPPFEFEHMADSSPGLITRFGLLVSNLRIDERGTTAGANTTVTFDQRRTEPSPASGEVAPSRIKPFSRRDDNIDFVANHPFLFFIRDNKYGRMLFSGGLTLPFGAVFEVTVPVGPWGGSGGSKWVYHPNRPIKRIIIQRGDFIDSITFVSEDGENSQRFGGPGGHHIHEVLLGSPGEYLKGISGTFQIRSSVPTSIMSLAFSTNIGVYGPFGVSGNQAFSVPIEEGNIAGFHGRAGSFVDAIGCIVTNISPQNSISIGPWGGSGGGEWVYQPNRPIKKIIIRSGSWIDHIKFETEDGDSKMFGGGGGQHTHEVSLSSPGEYLTGMSGTFGPNPQPNGPIFIRSLAFSTNITTHGPFGVAGNQAFSLPIESGAILGFHGRAGSYLDAIGVIVSNTPLT